MFPSFIAELLLLWHRIFLSVRPPCRLGSRCRQSSFSGLFALPVPSLQSAKSHRWARPTFFDTSPHSVSTRGKGRSRGWERNETKQTEHKGECSSASNRREAASSSDSFFSSSESSSGHARICIP
uniref:Putative secreted protein n=1 Tax=Ixodes ricinus TaxID=34613 RepID=A0A6B0UP76_IXORI